MDSKAHTRLLNNIVSPYGLAMISYVFFLFACFIPPSTYSHYMHEPDLMFLDPATILFYSLCVAFFLAGVWLIGWLNRSAPISDPEFNPRISPTVFLLAPLTCGIALTTASIFLLITQNPMLILYLMVQQGSNLKSVNGVEVEGTLMSAPAVLIALIWWAFSRYSNAGPSISRRWLVKSALWIASLLVIIEATLVLNRTLLMLLVCGLGILYIVRRMVKKQIDFKFVFKIGVGAVIGVVALFFAFSFLRGSQSLDDQVYMLFGYTVSSYNRLAALLAGSLRYPYGGRGVYLSSFLNNSHTVNRIIPLTRMLAWPDSVQLLTSEFAGVSQAGLDGSMIWSGAFGYIFSDLGWFTLPFLFGYGLLYGVVWGWMKSGKALGVVLYPYMGFCTLFWLGSNYLLDSQFGVFCVVALVLTGYEAVCTRPPNTSPHGPLIPVRAKG